MSSSFLLPSSTVQRVASPASAATACSTARMGVIPDPAHTITNLRTVLRPAPAPPLIEHRPRPRYSNRPTGPLISTQWPSGSESSAIVIAPPRCRPSSLAR